MTKNLERKKKIHREKQIAECPFSIPRYNLSLRTCIPDLKFVEISLTKNLERKNKEHIKERTNRRRSIFNPTIQLVVVNLYTKYEVSIFNGCGDILTKNLERKKKE